MGSVELKEKRLDLERQGSESAITVSHITIRQSISFLLLRLILIEVIAVILIIFFHTFISNAFISEQLDINYSLFNIPIFIFLTFIKTGITLFVILQWLNEYYEITTKEVIYKKGFINKTEQRIRLEHIGNIKLNQGLLGRLFNFGTIKLFNWTTEKDVLLYLIHNPQKYEKILETLIPDADRSKEVFREHLLGPEDDSL